VWNCWSRQPQGINHVPLRSLMIGREAKAFPEFLSYVALPHKTFLAFVQCNTCITTAPAILRETSRQTSYQVVRWVFRPYAQLRRTICTSVLRPASTTLSHGFAVAGYSSPPFGSRHRVLTLKTVSDITKVWCLLQAAGTQVACHSEGPHRWPWQTAGWAGWTRGPCVRTCPCKTQRGTHLQHCLHHAVRTGHEPIRNIP